MVNRKTGYGLQVLCVVRLYGPKACIHKMELVEALFIDGLL